MQTHDLQGFSYENRQGLLPVLTSAFTQCGGWVLERKTISEDTVEFRIEIQLHSIIELYASIVASGVELTRPTHDTLTLLCTSRRQIARTRAATQIVCIRLELSFLDDINLHSFLTTGSGPA